MKIAILALAACLTVPVKSSGLRSLVGDESSSETAIATVTDEHEQGERELLSPWCDKDTPTKWHPDYTRSWSASGCVFKADCNQAGSDTQAECCAQYYGGQTGGECTPIIAAATGTGGTKWYADYGTAWPTAGCKSESPYPIYASTLYDTQLDCCKAAYAGQSSGACLKGLASPPTSSPTVPGDFGTDWYADYATSWSIAGCKNTLPRPNYAIQLYKTQLECCKAAYGGQTSEKCVQSLPSPPTKSPSKKPTFKPTSSPSRKPTTSSPSRKPTTSSPSAKPVTSAPIFPTATTGRILFSPCTNGSQCGTGLTCQGQPPPKCCSSTVTIAALPKVTDDSCTTAPTGTSTECCSGTCAASKCT